MNKSILYCLPILIFSINLKASDDINIEKYQIDNMFVSCIELPDKNKSIGCLNNTHNLIKGYINKKLLQMKDRDKIYFLNTKGLQLKIAQQKCDSPLLSSLSKKSCVINYELAGLNYLLNRYKS